MHRFTIAQPETLDEASALLLAHEESRVIAGGTALVILMKEGLLHPTYLIALRRIAGLDRIEDAPQRLRLGSMVTQHALEISALIRQRLPVLADAAAKVGNIRVRTVSTVGGSLAEADYQSDLAPTLAVLGAAVQVHGPQGRRTLAVVDFLKDMYETDLRPGEIVVGVDVPLPPAGSRTAYVKHVTGPITDRPCLGVAATVTIDDEGICRGLRVALSSVMGFSSRPLVVDGPAAGVEGRRFDADAIEAVAERVYALADPPDDLRASAWYRKEMTRVFTRRALEAARASIRRAAS
ncbi:MAG: FAD binding domain-containing protein [Armatimonadota bacterium]